MQYVVVCDTSGWYLEFVDPIFLGIYIVELVIKFYALRLYFFRDPWNWFGQSKHEQHAIRSHASS